VWLRFVRDAEKCTPDFRVAQACAHLDVRGERHLELVRTGAAHRNNNRPDYAVGNENVEWMCPRIEAHMKTRGYAVVDRMQYPQSVRVVFDVA